MINVKTKDGTILSIPPSSEEKFRKDWKTDRWILLLISISIIYVIISAQNLATKHQQEQFNAAKFEKDYLNNPLFSKKIFTLGKRPSGYK